MKAARKNMRTAALAWRRNGWHKFLVSAIQTRDYALSIERVIKRGGENPQPALDALRA